MSANAAVIAAIRAHHAELAAGLRERTARLLDVAGHGPIEAERTALVDWYRTELIPHARAEESTLYAAGAELPSARLLVSAMLAEHRTLLGLVDDLAAVRDPFAAASVAAGAEQVFAVHLAKENDQLLGALDAGGVDLPAVLAGMHEILGAGPGGAGGAGKDEVEAGCGCDCGCGH